MWEDSTKPVKITMELSSLQHTGGCYLASLGKDCVWKSTVSSCMYMDTHVITDGENIILNIE